MMDPYEILEEIQPEILGKSSEVGEVRKVIDSIEAPALKKEIPKIRIESIIKAPLIVFVLGNILFSLILFLRARLLADTFSTAQNKIVKSVIVIYIITTVIGSLLALLFLVLA